MSFPLPFGIRTLNPVFPHHWAGPFLGNTEAEAIAAANAFIPAGVRLKGMEVVLYIAGVPKKYWYYNGTTDTDLVAFSSESATAETDPTVPSHVKAITTTQISNWDSAYGWGNHASAGYLTTAVAAATYIPLSQKGAASGVVPLNASSKIDEIYLPDSVLGQVEYMGTWNASTNTPTLPTPATSNKGHYYIVNVAGTQFTIDFNVGDWVISDGTAWSKVDNTDAISSFNGRTGAIVLTSGDVTTALGYTPINPNGTTLQYFRGDGSLATFPTAVSAFSNDAGYLTIVTGDARYSQLGHTHTFASLTAKPSDIAGYGITDAYTITQINNFFAGSTAITGYNKSLWDTAYGWGNHASAGYLLSSTAASTYVPLTRTINGLDLSANLTLTTTNIGEGTNLYYTDARARAALSAGTGISYNNTTGVISSTITQYTDALARASLSFAAGSGGYNSTTGVITIPTNTNQLTNGAGFLSQAYATIQANGTGLTQRSALNYSSEFTVADNVGSARTDVSVNSIAWSKITGAPSFLTGNQTITLSGDATGSGATSIALTLANSGVTAGTYTKVTVDAKGRVTTGASLASGDVTGALGYTPYNATNPSGYLSSVSLTSNVTGTLPVANGGTGQTTIAGIQSALGLGSYAYRSSGLAELSGATFTGQLETNGNLIANTPNNASIIILGGNPTNNWEGDIRFITSNTQTNWRLSSNRTTAGAFTITPSTTAGGSTFSTPLLTLASTGAATFSSSVTASSFIASGPNAGLFNQNVASGNGYALVVTGASGAARDIFIAGQTGYSNGFTVQYNGTNMVYQMLNGNLTVDGSVSATQFNGSGAGLTGTASSLTAGAISGQANSATISATISADANAIVRRDGSGDAFFRYINTSQAQENGTVTGIITRQGDNYMRVSPASTVQAFLGLGTYAYRSSGLAELSGATFTGALNGTIASFSSAATAEQFNSNGGQFFSYTLKGRSSDNYGAFGFYSNNGATRYGYIQSHSSNGGQLVLNGDGGGQFILDSRGIIATGEATFSSSVTAPTFVKSSDRKLKDIIEDLGFGAYKYKLKDSGTIAYGYIADEVESWLPDSIKKNQIDGKYDGLDYDSIFTFKLNDHDKRITELENEVKRLKTILNNSNYNY